jgi:molybdate transport system ATP-binding protein
MSFLQWEAETLTLPGNPFDNGASVSWCIRSADILLHSRIRPSGGAKENPLTVTIEELMLVGGILI